MTITVKDMFELDINPECWVNRFEDEIVLDSSMSWKRNRSRIIQVIEMAQRIPWVSWETLVSIFGHHARAIARECELLVGEPITAPEPTPRREKRGGRMTVDGLIARASAEAAARARAAARRRGRQPRRSRSQGESLTA